VLAAAAAAGLPLATRPGESLEPSARPPLTRWWPDAGVESAEQAPVRSTGWRGPWRIRKARYGRGPLGLAALVLLTLLAFAANSILCRLEQYVTEQASALRSPLDLCWF
jgi:hypothetical protein